MDTFTINFEDNGKCKYQQIYDYIVKEITEGRLKEYERLPSGRVLSEYLKVSRNTINTAYNALVADGYISVIKSSHFFVLPYTRNLKFNEKSDDKKEFKYVLSQNGIDISQIPYNRFAKIYKDIIYNHSDLLDHGEKNGEFVLRKAIARLVYETRGIKCLEEQIIIGAGFEQLLYNLVVLFGNDAEFIFENPCFRKTFETIKGINRKHEFLYASKNDFDIERLKSKSGNILFTMPNHQYPMGYFMSNETKKKLLKWADEDSDRYIIEDDYDSEYTYEGDNRSIKGMDEGENVVYINTFSRIIAPSIKVAFMILPMSLLELWQKRIALYYNCFVSRFEQYSIAEFIERGYLFKHIRKMKAIYKAKRDLFIAHIKQWSFADKIEIFGQCGGTHFLLTYNTDLSEEELYQRCIDKGIKVRPLSKFCLTESNDVMKNTFVVGFGGLSNKDIIGTCKLWEDAWS